MGDKHRIRYRAVRRWWKRFPSPGRSQPVAAQKLSRFRLQVQKPERKKSGRQARHRFQPGRLSNMAQNPRVVLILILVIALGSSAGAQAPKFFPDDPIREMPPPLPVAKPARQDINEVLDFLSQSRRPRPRPAKPAGAVNTLGEVPDSEWFTNRHAMRRRTEAELKRGPGSSGPPLPPFTVIGGKTAGAKPGFRMKDSRGRTYFVKVDPLNYPELATAPDVIVSKFLYAVG